MKENVCSISHLHSQNRMFLHRRPGLMAKFSKLNFTLPVAPFAVAGTVTANATGQFSFTDPAAPQYAVRFYRFIQR